MQGFRSPSEQVAHSSNFLIGQNEYAFKSVLNNVPRKLCSPICDDIEVNKLVGQIRDAETK